MRAYWFLLIVPVVVSALAGALLAALAATLALVWPRR